MSLIPVYVLVGGASRRFGSDKASHPVDGEPWGLHVGRRLSGPDGKVVLVGSTSLEGCRRIEDAPGVAGPVAGIVAALADRGRTYGPGRLVVASCDLVRPDRGWLGLLTRALDDDPLAVAAAFRDGERWQPFPMIATTSALPVARAFVDGGGESVGGLLERCGAAGLAWPGVIGGPPQANTPEELAKALSSDPAEGFPLVAQGLPR